MFDREKLLNYINNIGIKQKVICQNTNISESAMSGILTGKRKCEVNEFISICRFLNVNPNEFIRSD